MANKRDEFIKLRSAGLDPVSARKQVYGDVTPATPAPTVTPATPAQTAPVTPTPDINSDANRLARAQQGGSQRLIENLTPATPTPVAPVTPTTPTEPIAPVAPTTIAPVAPAPVTPAPATPTPPEVPMAAAPTAPVAPVPAPTTTPTTTPKVEKPADNRQAQINANLTEGFQTNPSLFSDRTAFDTAYNYATKTPEERAVLDSFYASKQPTIQNMYSAIASKADIPGSVKNTPAYKIANIQYQNAKNFAGMTTAQLSKEMDSANIVEGSTTWENMMAMNPKLAKDAQNLRIVNGSKTNLFSTEKAPDGSAVKVNNLEKLFGKEFAETFGTFMDEMYKVQTPEEIKAQIYTPEVQKAQEQAQKIESEMNVIQDALDAVDKDVEKELAGSGASASRIALEKARRNEDLTDQYNSLQRKYTTQYNIQSELIKQNTATMQEAQQQKQAKNAALLPFVQAQAKTQMEKTAQEQALNDPATQIGATMDEFASMGIPTNQSLQTKVADAQRFIAQGGTLAGYIDQMRKDYMNKDEYKALSEFNKRKLAPEQKQFSFANLGDGRIAIQDPNTGKVTFATAGSVSPAAAPTKTSEKYLNIPTGTDVGVQCGTFARELCGLDATPGGNSLDARKKAFVDEAPIAGGMVLFTGGGYDKTYGHIASIESVNQDGTLNIVESNLNGDNKVTRRTIQANDPAISGFYNNTPLAKGTGSTATQGASTDAQNWFNLIQKGTTSYEDVMKKLGGTKVGQAVLQEINGLISSQGGAIPALPDSPQVKQMDTLLSTVKGLVDDPDAIENLSGFFQISPWDAMTGKNDDTRSAIEFLVKGQTLQQLIDAKAQGATFGALSNEELKMLQNSANRLTSMIEFDETGKVKSFKGSEKTVKAELKKLLDTFTEKREKMVNPGLNKNTTPTGTGSSVDIENEWKNRNK